MDKTVNFLPGKMIQGTKDFYFKVFEVIEETKELTEAEKNRVNEILTASFQSEIMGKLKEEGVSIDFDEWLNAIGSLNKGNPC